MFYEQIKFSNLSQEKLHLFFDTFDLSNITSNLWRIIYQCLYNKDKKTTADKSRYHTIGLLFPLKEREFDGIIKYLTTKKGGNLYRNGTINVTSSTGGGNPENLLDFNYDTNYLQNQTNGWVCFDFKDMKVNLTNHQIKSYSSGRNGHHLRTWNIEASNDN